MSNVSMLNLNNPKLHKGRSKFNLTHTSHVDFNMGYLIPLDTPIEVMPGDTIKLKQRTIVRMSNPPKVPVMDTLVMTIAYYYVPFRIVWDNWDKFITANNGTQWDQDLVLSVPQVTLEFGSSTGKVYSFKSPNTHTALGSGGLLDYLGIPTLLKANGSGSDSYCNMYIRAFEIRGYYKIWNRFWRFEPLMDSAYLDTSNNNVVIDETKSYVYGPQSNKLCPVCRLSGYFSRALPAPQRGEEVLMDLSIPETYDIGSISSSSQGVGLVSPFSRAGESLVAGTAVSYGNGLSMYAGLDGDPIAGFSNLFGGSINSLRQAFAIQRLKDIDARYGSRIGEFTIGHYGVNVPDFRISEPEELAYKTFDININQVVQTSETTASSPQGTTGAYSATNHFDYYFTKSFVEWGLIYCVGTIRVKNHSFSQGIPHQYQQFDRFSYYFPELANISDMPIRQHEIMPNLQSGSSWDNVFGYQEAWAWYKYLPSRVAHHMRPQDANTLAIWTYTDLYASAPTLSAGWIQEPVANVDRTMYLASSSTVSQFIADMCFFIDAYRVMPYHSIPGGLTHEF